jgi:hypothetical protein
MVKLEGRHSTVNLSGSSSSLGCAIVTGSKIKKRKEKKKENNRFLAYSTRGGNIRGK